MAKRGGSATVYGVLYQMLGSIRWATQLQLLGTLDSEDLQSATLILEPRDGGDMQIDLPNTRIVEQW